MTESSQITISQLDTDGTVTGTSTFDADCTIQVGRHRDNDVVVSAPRVSRFHASIFFDGKCWHCAAFGGSAMRVGGIRKTHADLQSGMTIQFAPDNPQLGFEVIEESDEERLRGSMTWLIRRIEGRLARIFREPLGSLFCDDRSVGTSAAWLSVAARH